MSVHDLASRPSARLVGRTALVTGAADGIGLAIARAFAAEGARLALGDIDAPKLAAEAETLRAGGATIIALPCDVARSSDLRALADAALAATGRLDILVNNAAIALSGHAATMPEADWQRVLDVNLTGAFRAIQAVLPAMLRQGRGSIINISSTQASRSWDNWSAYAAAKGGLLSLTTQLAGQFGPAGIRVNALSPGAIDTPMNARRVAAEGEKLRELWAGMHALRRTGSPEEVASAAVFLASDESSFVTGHDLLVDGGLCTLPRYFDS